MQAEMVIKRMSEYNNQAADTSSGSLSSSLRNPAVGSDDNGNNNASIPDYANNNEVGHQYLSC